MGIYTSSEINLSHADCVKLYHEGKCTIRLSHKIVEITHNSFKNEIPTSSKTSIVYLLIAGYGTLGLFIYLSFTSTWWLFTIGLLANLAFGRKISNIKTSDAINVLLNNSAAYHMLKVNGLLVYEMDNSIAKDYM